MLIVQFVIHKYKCCSCLVISIGTNQGRLGKFPTYIMAYTSWTRQGYSTNLHVPVTVYNIQQLNHQHRQEIIVYQRRQENISNFFFPLLD